MIVRALVVVAAASAALLAPATAAAAPCSEALDPPVCDRLQLILEELQSPTADRDVRVVGVDIPPGAFEERSAGELPVADGVLRELTDMDGETTTSTKVRLSDGDRLRLERTTYLCALLVGVQLIALMTPWLLNAFGKRWGV